MRWKQACPGQGGERRPLNHGIAPGSETPCLGILMSRLFLRPCAPIKGGQNWSRAAAGLA